MCTVRSLFVAAFLASAALLSCTPQEEPTAPPTPPADHHVHIRSEASSEALATLQQTLSGREMEPPPPTGADEVVALLDSAGIEHASLLSLAYFFGIPDMEFENEYRKVRAENDYVIAEAERYPNRLMAFCSVQPLADYAVREMERCAETGSVTGLKLHLANSNVDLRDPAQRDSLRIVFEEADRLDLPVVVHLFTRNPEYGRRDVRLFVDSVLARVPDLPVQIAHVGAAGVFDATTDTVVSAFRDRMDARPELFDGDVVFDVAAAALDPARFLARGDTARADSVRSRNEELARHLRTLGTGRVVFGTDWIGGARRPPDYLELFRTLPLEEDELRTLLESPAPYVPVSG